VGAPVNIFKDYLDAVGQRIRKLRQQKKLSHEKLGLEIGLTRMQVNRIEKGYNITLKTLLKLAIALDTKPGNLIKTSLKFKKEDIEKLIGQSKKKTS
jgi:transcriptional regulator with XRE-family HTH domain